MPSTPRMQWPYPARDSDPWFTRFDEMVTAMDVSAFAAREDRHLLFVKGGNFSWNLAAKRLTWDDTIEVVSPISGFRNDVLANNVLMDDGEFLYIDLERPPTSNITTLAVVDGTVPSTDSAYVICTRRGDEIYFRTGEILFDGQTRSLFGPRVGSVGDKEIDVLNVANRTSGISNIPISVGAIQFDPTDHDRTGLSQSLYFRAVASNGIEPLLTHVKLVNVTDGEDVVTLDFTSSNLTKQEASLVRGAGVGQIDSSPHVYEVQIFLDAIPAGAGDTIELYSAEIRVVNTIV